MEKDTKKYNITDENLHKFILAIHSFVEDYSTLYSKLYLLDVFVDKLDYIELNDIDTVDIFTDCISHLVKDVFAFANSLYLKSKDVCYSEFGEVTENGRK